MKIQQQLESRGFHALRERERVRQIAVALPRVAAAIFRLVENPQANPVEPVIAHDREEIRVCSAARKFAAFVFLLLNPRNIRAENERLRRGASFQ